MLFRRHKCCALMKEKDVTKFITIVRKHVKIWGSPIHNVGNNGLKDRSIWFVQFKANGKELNDIIHDAHSFSWELVDII